MNPETIAAGFVAAHHGRRRRQMQSRFPLTDRALDRCQIPTGDRPQPRRDPKTPTLQSPPGRFGTSDPPGSRVREH
jgi:hypothetical protein